METETLHLELLREDMRVILDMTLFYRIYRVLDDQNCRGYAMEARLSHNGLNERSPLFLFDRNEPRACAFYRYLLDAEVLPCTLGDVLEDACGHFLLANPRKKDVCSLQIPKNMVK